MKDVKYAIKGVCPKTVEFSISEEETVHNIRFSGGCPGNLTAIQTLCEGKTVDELYNMLNGITCGPRSTSCSDQLVQALKNSVSN